MTSTPDAVHRRRLSGGVRDLLVDSPVSVGARARARRWDLIQTIFPDIGEMCVLDLGGTVESWRRAPVHPAEVTVVNLTEPGEADDDWLIPVLGDACLATKVLRTAGRPGEYDLVFSNSLIEHVGGHAKRTELARQVHALSPRHWVQTPYRFFPVEPHWLFPLMQFLPVHARARVAELWPLTHTRPASRTAALAEVQWTELLSKTEMRSYFPTSTIVPEKYLGMTKSITATQA